jgi:preprotein translocase subunit YajC
MFISTAFAQTAGATGSAGDPIMSFLPLILIFVVFYFLLIRPQQKRAKDHKEMLTGLRRGDKVVTGGGIIGTVAKVGQPEEDVQIEIAENVRVRVVRSTITQVLSRTETAKPADAAPAAANDGAAKGGFLAKLFGRK